jgi:tRNA U38,U39,U40 pseudouridine synthase TruA
MCGTLLQCLNGHIKEPVGAIIEAKNRSEAGPTLPPHGLYLNKIFY